MAEKKVEWPEGLASAIDALKPLVAQSYEVQAESQRRLWKAQDEVDRLKRQLNDAEIVLQAAQRDYEQNGQMMSLVWEDFRATVMKVPLKATPGTSEPGQLAEAGAAPGLRQTP